MGDRSRLTKQFTDNTFEKLMRDADTGKLKHNLSPFYTRPAYSYTIASVGGIKNGVSNVRRVNPLTDL